MKRFSGFLLDATSAWHIWNRCWSPFCTRKWFHTHRGARRVRSQFRPLQRHCAKASRLLQVCVGPLSPWEWESRGFNAFRGGGRGVGLWSFVSHLLSLDWKLCHVLSSSGKAFRYFYYKAWFYLNGRRCSTLIYCFRMFLFCCILLSSFV